MERGAEDARLCIPPVRRSVPRRAAAQTDDGGVGGQSDIRASSFSGPSQSVGRGARTDNTGTGLPIVQQPVRRLFSF